jgi:hypothetical protein
MLHAKGKLHLGEDFDGHRLAQINGREPPPFHGRSGHVDRGLRGEMQLRLAVWIRVSP